MSDDSCRKIGRGQQRIAHHPFICDIRRFRIGGKFKTERPHQTDAALIRLTFAGVNIRRQLVTQANRVLRYCLSHRSINPRLAMFLMRSMHTKNRHERAELHPARIIFRQRCPAKTTRVHPPLRLPQRNRRQHAHRLLRHRFESGRNIPRPHPVSVSLRPEIKIAIQRPHPA